MLERVVTHAGLHAAAWRSQVRQREERGQHTPLRRLFGLARPESTRINRGLWQGAPWAPSNPRGDAGGASALSGAQREASRSSVYSRWRARATTRRALPPKNQRRE